MLHTTQLDRARRESYVWSRRCCWGRSNGTSYPRKLKSHKVVPRELWKQEALTFTVRGWRPLILKGFANEGCAEIWSEREAITSLYWTLANSWEIWKCGIQVGVTTIIGRSSQHLPRISAKEVFEGTRGCCIARSGTTRDRHEISRTSDQVLGPIKSCHKAQDEATMRKKKQHGRVKTFSILVIWIFELP
jgi:hypothetical protein